MITLYTTPRTEGGFPSLSPFCAKLEIWLLLSGVPFERRLANYRRAPNGKIPYIDLDGEQIGDSQRIIDRCTAEFGDRLDAHLDDRQRATARLVQRTLEEATYFGMIRGRWLTDHGFAFMRAAMLDKIIPPLVRPLAFAKIKRDLRRTLYGQGVLRYPLEEVYAAVIADADAVLTLMGDNPFMLGDEPTSIDATVYGFLGCVLASGFSDPAIDHLRASKPLTAYCERMVARLAAATSSS